MNSLLCLTGLGASGGLSRGEMSLAEVQCHLDKEGASDLVIDLIMNTTSDRVFQESILLAIALLEGGNTTIQVCYRIYILLLNSLTGAQCVCHLVKTIPLYLLTHFQYHTHSWHDSSQLTLLYNREKNILCHAWVEVLITRGSAVYGSVCH